MLKTIVCCALVLATAVWAMAADDVEVIPIPNGGLEEGAENWKIEEFEGVRTYITDEQAHSGEYSLRITDTHDKNGSTAITARVPVKGMGVHELRGWHYPISGGGLGVYVRAIKADGSLAAPGDQYHRGIGGDSRKWTPFSLAVYPTEDTATLELWLHSYSHAKVDAYVDDLEFVYLGDKSLDPPWEGQYKIRPDETERLTAADVVGPDGIVYPNWTRCGVQGGIPEVKAFARVEEYGGQADDDLDDATALDAACVAAGRAGGGAVVLGEGTYYLDRPVTIRHSGVVIRGQGADRTRVIFRYAVSESGVNIYAPEDGSKVGKRTQIEMHAMPTGLMKMRVMVGDEVIKTWERSTHSGNSFVLLAWGSQVVGKVPDGRHSLKAVAEYDDGSEKTAEITIDVDSAHDEKNMVPYAQAVFTFAGAGLTGPQRKLAEDGGRGAEQIKLEDAGDLRDGDRILVYAPATERWKGLTRNACQWGHYRRYQVQVNKVEGNTLHLDQPLRIEFPVIDGSYVQKVEPIDRCGVEDFYLEQTEDLWITSAQFRFGWNCWGRGVTVRKCGRNPIYGSEAKFCEIRDCVFDDAWYKGGGGTAYAGWELSYDCLMDGCETFKFRHGPLFQWAASGCVIRNSVFHESDAQWHSGWTNENLMENCVVESSYGNGGYGFGMWASPPEDTAHGPNGPRNVVYNCDVISEKDGLWMGGMNENWLILHNRFVVKNGRGVFMKTASFDHIIKGNVFALRGENSPMVWIASPDCAGVELIDNKLYGGNGKLSSGVKKPVMDEGNEILPLGEELPARPEPVVKSIYQWQLDNCVR